MVFRSLKYRRISAIILDLLIISLLTSLLFNNSISNPYYNDYQNNTKEYNELVSNVNPNDFNTPDGVIQFKNKFSDVLHKTVKSNLFYYIWYVVLSFLYFVLFQYSTGGKTLGKKLYGIRITNKESNKKLSILRLIGKTFCAGELFFFDGIVFICILNIIGILFINNTDIFFYYNALVNIIGIVFEIVLLVTYFKNKNAETITDKIFKTKVIEIK